MTPEVSSKRPLTQLNHEIEQAEAEAGRLEAERKIVTKDAARAGRRLRYLQVARAARRPKASLELWPMAVLIVAPTIFGIVLFVTMHLVFGSVAISFLTFVAGIAAGAAVMASLLFRPADALLESATADAEAQLKLQNARLAEKNQRLAEVNERIQRLVDERRDQIASGKLQRAALLQRKWKSMGDAEWEDFVVEVCRTLGASVERRSAGGSQDANLILQVEGRRVAVFTRGEGHNVSSAAVQQAIAARDRLHCESCAVIINRRFTGAAQDFAQRHGCAAIGSGEFPDFVLGKIEL
jgi:uncharacterized protein YhaN